MTKTAGLILYYKRLIEYLVLDVWRKVVMCVTSQQNVHKSMYYVCHGNVCNICIRYVKTFIILFIILL